MKNQRLLLFLSGMGFSVLLITLFSFVKGPGVPALNGTNAIDPQTASTYRQNYLQIRGSQGVTAINLSIQQWEAINQIVNARGGDLSGLSGFRLHFGAKSRDTNAAVVSIAYPINDQLEEIEQPQGMPMAEDFDQRFAQQCPPFCD